MVKVVVKWLKNSYDVDVDVSSGLEEFQASLFSLTNVPVDRQKLMVKGKLLKTDRDLESLTSDSKVMLMGTADAVSEGPAKPVVFEEDLSDKDRILLTPESSSRVSSAGLVNLGNTCYMNSTLQAFRAVPELKQALIRYAATAGNTGGGGAADREALVTKQLGTLMQEMDSSSTAITPMLFTTVFRSSFAQFAERNSEGQWAQQDADECLQTLIQVLAHKLGSYTPEQKNSSDNTTDTTPQNTIDYIFGGELQTVTRCTESPAEPERKSTESFRKLRCHIDSKIAFLSEGLAADMQSDLEMRSTVLDRPAIWHKRSAISKLPRYLIVQFVRFDWRKDTQKKAKVLKKVEFPLRLDLSEFCTPALKRSLLAARRTLKDEEDKKLGLTSLSRSKNLVPAAIKAQADKQKQKEKEAEEKKTGGQHTEGEASPSTSATTSSSMDVDDAPGVLLPTVTTGVYDLIAVITHKGRYADSGHYIGWSRSSVTSDVWTKYDDDVVSEVKSDEIKALSGGGDWHMSYLLIYARADDFLGRQFSAAELAAQTLPTSNNDSTAVTPSTAPPSS